MASPALVIDGIGAGAAEVTDGLISRFRDVDGLKIAGTMSPSQLFGIAPVGFNLVPGLAGNFRGSDHDAIVSELKQTPDQAKAAGTGFIAEVELDFWAVLLAQTGNELVDRVEAVARFAQAADLAVTARFGYRDRDGVFVDIESDVE